MYGKMLSRILDEIENSKGELVYRTGPIGQLQFDDLVESGRFVDEINDSRIAKRIQLKKVTDFIRKYDIEFSGVISLEVGGFKLYIDRIKGNWVMNHDNNADIEWYETLKMEILDTFPGALSIDLCFKELPRNDRVYVCVELNGMNRLFPESVYTCKEASFHGKMKTPLPKFHKKEFGKITHRTEEGAEIEEWVSWHEIWVGHDKNLYISEDQLPLDCESNMDDNMINDWIRNNLLDQLFWGENWLRDSIEDIFVANDNRLKEYTEFHELFSERTFNEDGGITAHICFLMQS